MTFNTECTWDYLRIYDNESNKKMAEMCGERSTNLGFKSTFVSTGQTLYINFKADAIITLSGFNIGFEYVGNIEFDSDKTRVCQDSSECHSGTCTNGICACSGNYYGDLCENCIDSC